ncbi:SacI homology domain-containing protein [Lipomyces japonicus]|uniref:SacI homology domain-containing protein n=1 Tax=Lipomyces japonicus TaxID=56871 RepID=UPI0034CEA1C7
MEPEDPAFVFASVSDYPAAASSASANIDFIKANQQQQQANDPSSLPPPLLSSSISFLNFVKQPNTSVERVAGFEFVKEEVHGGVPPAGNSNSSSGNDQENEGDNDIHTVNADPLSSTTAQAYDASFNRMCKYTLYETKTRFYLIGSNMNDTRFRVLKIDLTAENGDLVLTQDDTVYTHAEIIQLLEAIQDGNPAGGLVKRLTSWGVIGFIRFTSYYYMSVITKRSAVALLGGHYIYHIDSTELIPLCSSASYRKPHRNSEEARFLSTFQNLDLSKTFYFCYSYDITHTLQRNLHRARQSAKQGKPATAHSYDLQVYSNYNEIWCLPIIHGFIDQANISVYGRNVSIALIARRSHYFAGARFLKRGANDQGYVANDVETEQIVSDMLTTSFHSLDGQAFVNPRYTSFVQHRGSIPLFWTQDVSGMSPKPPIELNVVDPFYSAAALHFDHMFERYGTPVVVFNLIKTRERTPRETILLREFEQCLQYLNQFLPEKVKILYTSWDMSRASKGRDQEVIEFLEEYADRILRTTKIFHNGPEPQSVQSGVCRTNCIDCLDRTNAAQFVVGKRALGYQLQALGVIKGNSVDYDTDAVNLLTEMYHDHGDTIALQYGGSHLVNTMETYRRINQWTSHSRDVIESIKRYYSNSFIDSQRQEAINLFLGNYVFEMGQPMLWDLSTDYYLHHGIPNDKKSPRRSYRKWWRPINLQKTITEREVTNVKNDDDGDTDVRHHVRRVKSRSGLFFDNYWMEYYKPKMLSSFSKIFHYNINSTLRYLPSIVVGNSKYNLSPFEPRQVHMDHSKDLIEKERIQDDRSSIISVISTRRTRKFLDIGFIDFSSKSDRSPSPPPLVKDDSAALSVHSSNEEEVQSLTMFPSSSDDNGFDNTLWCYGGGDGGVNRDKNDVARTRRHQQQPPDMPAIVDHITKPMVLSSEAHEYRKYLTNPDLAPLTMSEKRAMLRTHQHAEFENYVRGKTADYSQLNITPEDDVCYQQHVLIPEVVTSMVIANEEETKKFKTYQLWLKTNNGQNLK